MVHVRVFALMICLLPVHFSLADGLDLFGGMSSEQPLLQADPEFLHPDQAFVLSLSQAADGHLLLRVDIVEGYYLYRDKFRFSLEDDEIGLGEVNLPPGTIKDDPYFGPMAVYTESQEFRLPLTGTRSTTREVQLGVAFQGCAEAGICYPPENKLLPVSLTAGGDTGAAMQTRPATAVSLDESPARQLSESEGVARLLADKNLLVVLAAFFGFGLALSLTPCVFPMIPILSGIIVGQGERLTTRHAFLLSCIYVLAMALTYAVIGMIAGSFGQNLQALFQDPRVLVAFAAVFVALALSMFGFYELQLPTAWQSRLTTISNRQNAGSYQGVFVMGLLSALIVGPCVAPPLAGTLIYIGQSGDAVLGGLALFVMALGMGVPLLLIGASAGKWLPKAGVWMESVKQVFGVLMLAVAIWLLERILPAAATMILWAVLLIVSAVFLGALDSLDAVASNWRRLWKGVGVFMLVCGTLLLVGVASGGRDPLRPLPLGSIGVMPVGQSVEFRPIKGPAGLEQAIAEAGGKPVMLDFYADWCIECKRMQRTTFADTRVQSALGEMQLVKADVTANDNEDRALLQGFSLLGPPAILFFDAEGNELRGMRIDGFMNATDFHAHLLEVGARCNTLSC